MSDTATGEQLRLSYCIQIPSTPGVVPDNPEFILVPFKIDGGMTLKPTVETNESTEYKPDGGPGDPTIKKTTVAGDHAFSFRPLADGTDEIILAGLYSAPWHSIHSTPGKVDISGATYSEVSGELNLSTAATIPDQILNKQEIEIFGGGGTTIGKYILTFVSANIYTLYPKPALPETLPATTYACGEVARNGQTEHVNIYQEHQEDILYRNYFIGLKVNKAAYAFEIDQDVTYTLSMQGQGWEIKEDDEKYAGQSLVTPDEFAVFPVADDTATLTIDGVGQVENCAVTALSFSVTRELNERMGIFKTAPCGIDPGASGLEGSISVGFQDGSMWDRLKNGTPMLIRAIIPGTEDIGYSWTIPRAILSGNDIPVNKGSRIQTASFLGGYDANYGCRFQINRFDRR